MRQWLDYRKTGSAPDPEAEAVPPEFWHEATNVLFREGSATPLRDARYIWEDAGTQPNAAAQFLLYSPDSANAPWWIGCWANLAGAIVVKKWQGTSAFAYTDITQAAWAAGILSRRNIITGGNFNGTAVINAGSNLQPHYYNTTAGGATTTVLPGWAALDAAVGGAGVRIRSLRPYKYHLIALNCTEAGVRMPQKIRWSSASAAGALPATWIAAAGNEAGDVILSDASGELIDSALLGQSMMIYGEQSTYRMTYVGGGSVMSLAQVSKSSGILSTNCVTDIGGAHVVLTRTDVVMVTEDGQVQSLASGLIRNRLFDLVASAQKNVAMVTFNKCRGEVWVLVPAEGQTRCARAFVYDLASKSWADESLGGIDNRLVTAVGQGPASQLTTGAAPASERAVLCFGIEAASGIQVTFLSLNDPLADTSSYTNQGNSGLRANKQDLGDPDRRKTLTGVRLIGEFGTGEVVNLYVYTRERRDAAAVTNGPYIFTAGTTGKIDVLLNSRFFDFEFAFTASTTIDPWKMAGFQVEYQMGGLW